MAASLATLLPPFDPGDIAYLTSVLRDDATSIDDARKDFRPFPLIENKAPLLSHAIYVERNATGFHGSVTLFGAIRMYCKFTKSRGSNESRALLATLDISTGQEEFLQVDLQGLTEAPLVLGHDEIDHGCKMWMAELQRQITEAENEKGWSVVGQMSRQERAAIWQSSTFDGSSPSWISGLQCQCEELS